MAGDDGFSSGAEAPSGSGFQDVGYGLSSVDGSLRVERDVERSLEPLAADGGGLARDAELCDQDSPGGTLTSGSGQGAAGPPEPDAQRIAEGAATHRLVTLEG